MQKEMHNSRLYLSGSRIFRLLHHDRIPYWYEAAARFYPFSYREALQPIWMVRNIAPGYHAGLWLQAYSGMIFFLRFHKDYSFSYRNMRPYYVGRPIRRTRL